VTYSNNSTTFSASRQGALYIEIYRSREKRGTVEKKGTLSPVLTFTRWSLTHGIGNSQHSYRKLFRYWLP